MDIVSTVFAAARARTTEEVIAAVSHFQSPPDRQQAELVFSRIAAGDLGAALAAVEKLLEPHLVTQLEAFWAEFEYSDNFYRTKGGVPRTLPLFDQQYDHLVYDQSITLFRVILFYFRSITRPRRKAAVVVTVRNEGPWLVEWIAHYVAAGIDIICYYNDIDDGSDNIIRLCGDNGLLVPIENIVDPRVPSQIKAYEHALFLNPRALEYEWLMFFDADEFLISTSGIDIETELSQLSASRHKQRIDAIMVHWRWMSNGFQYEWEDGPLFSRFQHGLRARWVKSIIRPTTTWSMRYFHYPILPAGTLAIDSSGELLASTVEASLDPPKEPRLELLHFYSKSFQEFAVKKHRGRATQGVAGDKRNFENFTWGLRGTLPFEIPSQTVVGNEVKMRDILRIPGMLEACIGSTRSAREKVASMERDLELRQEFQKLKEIE